MTPNELRKLAEEATQWLADNADDQFNICCQRCNAPFSRNGHSIAAPAEWFGVLQWGRQVSDLARLCAELGEALEPFAGLDPSEFYVEYLELKPEQVLAARAALARLAELTP